MNRRQRAMLLYAIWAAVILVFFSFSTRQEYYAIPALPALALLIGGWLQKGGCVARNFQFASQWRDRVDGVAHPLGSSSSQSRCSC